MSEEGRFRPIQSGFAMLDNNPSEADIATAGIYQPIVCDPEKLALGIDPRVEADFPEGSRQQNVRASIASI